MTLRDAFAPLVGPLIPAVIGVAGFLLRQWWQRRDADHRANEALCRAQDEVAFISAWWSLQRRLRSPAELAPYREVATGELERAYTMAHTSRPGVRREGRTNDLRQLWTSLLLLRLHTWPGRSMRVLYWISLAWLVLWTVIGTSVTSLTLIDVLAALTAIALVGVAPAWLLRWAAKTVDTSAHKRATAGR